MKDGIFEITENRELAPGVFRLKLRGDTSALTKPGQFLNIRLDGFFLRRPLSLCDLEGDEITAIYKTVGAGTGKLSEMKPGEKLSVLTGLGNGFSLEKAGDRPLLVGGGSGVPPMYLLAKKLIAEGKNVSVILGFNTASEVYYEEEFKALGCSVSVTTADGSRGIKGLVTDAPCFGFSCWYACGPEPMLRALHAKLDYPGQLSFDRRMGCGFGACMGCSCKTVTGGKRICKEGPVLDREEIIWED